MDRRNVAAFGLSLRHRTPSLRPAVLARGAAVAPTGTVLHPAEWSRAATVRAGMARAIMEVAVRSSICASPSCAGRPTADTAGRVMAALPVALLATAAHHVATTGAAAM